QIKCHVEVVVAERLVLFRIEYLKQRRGWITAEVAPQLIDLIQQQHRVFSPGAPHRLKHPPRHRTDIGASMTTQFGFIMQATQAKALELASQRSRDRLPP